MTNIFNGDILDSGDVYSQDMKEKFNSMLSRTLLASQEPPLKCQSFSFLAIHHILARTDGLESQIHNNNKERKLTF